jgi:uncharacterized protein YheU (UPF0270 family)
MIVVRNGTATGGTEDQIEASQCDFEHVSDGNLVFQHGETSKQIVIRINPDCQVMVSNRT